MRRKKRRFLGQLTFWSLGALAFGADLELKIDGEVAIFQDSRKLVGYRGEGRVPCLYPLIGPTGTNVTRRFPFIKEVLGEAEDHPHHTSFWVAHGSVNGEDFWHDGDNRIRHEEILRHGVEDGGRVAFFTVGLTWMAGKEEVLREKRSYRVTVVSPHETWVELESILTASRGEVTFGDTKEGMVAIRVAPTFRLRGEVGQGMMLNSEGRRDDQCWGHRAKWVAYQGPDENGDELVVALMDHRENLRHPTWWHARHYGLLAANPFGRHDFEGRPEEPQLGEFTLKAGDSLTQRYLLVLQAGALKASSLEAIWQDWR